VDRAISCLRWLPQGNITRARVPDEVPSKCESWMWCGARVTGSSGELRVKIRGKRSHSSVFKPLRTVFLARMHRTRHETNRLLISLSLSLSLFLSFFLSLFLVSPRRFHGRADGPSGSEREKTRKRKRSRRSLRRRRCSRTRRTCRRRFPASRLVFFQLLFRRTLDFSYYAIRREMENGSAFIHVNRVARHII